MPDHQIILEISGAQRNSSWESISYRVRANNLVRFADIDLTGDQIDDVDAIGEIYQSLFDIRSPPRVKAAQMKALGIQLFKLWLEPYWQKLTEGMLPTSRRLLVVASDQPWVLNLPWELLRVPGAIDDSSDTGWPIGVVKAWGVCRYPSKTLPNHFGPVHK